MLVDVHGAPEQYSKFSARSARAGKCPGRSTRRDDGRVPAAALRLRRFSGDHLDAERNGNAGAGSTSLGELRDERPSARHSLDAQVLRRPTVRDGQLHLYAQPVRRELAVVWCLFSFQ